MTASLRAELLGLQLSRLNPKMTAWDKNFANQDKMYLKSAKIAEKNMVNNESCHFVTWSLPLQMNIFKKMGNFNVSV
ncbi:MAG: hypothetical protein K9N35_01330 [Candidatus Marinimicrobia bacterium]|nr:hypothetical protein [Candidatus Neomarinimicrobiota bacterium]